MRMLRLATALVLSAARPLLKTRTLRLTVSASTRNGVPARVSHAYRVAPRS